MNQHLQKLNKIEFVITDACTGRCRHCSQGDHPFVGEHIDPAIAADAVRKIAAEYPITTVMTFGGEPLLYPEVVYTIMNTATEFFIPCRQVITNGYFAKNSDTIRDVAECLAACGVNDLLLSVDAFHQETISLDVVRNFAVFSKKYGIPMRLQPAWLISPADDNRYNRETRRILDSFVDLDIPVGEGNTVFCEGNAKKFLSPYFADTLPENPYIDDPGDVRCVSFSPNGDVLGDNVYRRDIMEIIKHYTPKQGVIM